MLQTFYDKFTFMLAFMIFVVFFNMVFGEKATRYFLALVLASMVVTNADKISSLFKNLEGVTQ